MNFDELRKELWILDNVYCEQLQIYNHGELEPVVRSLLLLAKILLYRFVKE